MKYKNMYDLHTHSVFSFDAEDSCDALCESAIKMNAAGVAITDHCDIDGDDDYNKLCHDQFKDTQRVKEKYKDKLKVFQGLEIGQGIYRKPIVEKYLKEYDYDIILGSIHNLENMEDFYFLDYSEFDVDELLRWYFEDVLKLCMWGEFDSLAHLTYPLRYIVGRNKINVDITKYYPLIDEIFLSLIKNKKALEINTSGYFMEIGEPLPNEELIKRYRSLGGEYITIGSDSHFAEKLFQGVEAGYDLAKKCGFNKLTLFEKREPVLINIE